VQSVTQHESEGLVENSASEMT